MLKDLIKNMAQSFSDSGTYSKTRKHMLTEAVATNFYNKFKDKGKFKAVCVSGGPQGENKPNPEGGGIIMHPIKVRVNGIFDELIPNPCGDDYKDDPAGAMFLISMHPTIIPSGPLNVGERTPGFGEEIFVEFVKNHPHDNGKMRGFRYEYPKTTAEYDYDCAQSNLQGLVGQFSATGPTGGVLGDYTSQSGDRPFSETGLATQGDGLYFGSRRRKRKVTHIIVHSTAGWSKKGAIRTLKKKHLSYHYIIDYDGSIENLFDPATTVAFHAGNYNDISVGVSLVNVAYERDGVKEKAVANNTAPWQEWEWIHPKSGRKVSKRKWQPFTQEQVNSYIVLMGRLIKQFEIKKENIQMHAAVSKKIKMDPGPAFPWEESLSKLYGNTNS